MTNMKHVQNMAELRTNAPRPAIDLYHGDEVGTVIEALDYAADDLAYRASYEDKIDWPEGDDDAKEYRRAARKYARLADALRKRAGIT